MYVPTVFVVSAIQVIFPHEQGETERENLKFDVLQNVT